MKRIFVAALTLIITTVSAFAQSYESLFQFSFVPPLSTNGTRAVQYTNGVSLNLLVGISKNEKYFTAGGLANIITNNASGVQMAGFVNYVGNSASGAIFGGFVNVAGDMQGSQFGGFINVAKNVSGVQMAGFVNIAQSSDYPIALVNIIKTGEYGIGLSYNEIGNMMLTFRSGGRVTYGILGVGYNHKTKGNDFTAEGGFGAHINIVDWFRYSNEIKAGNPDSISDTNTFYANYALLPAFRLGRHFEIFGGPSINYMQTNNTENRDMFPSHSL